MKFVRYLAHGDISYGVVDGNIVREITNTPFDSFVITDHIHPLSDVKIINVFSKIDKVASKGIINKRKAANQKSRISKHLDNLK